MAELLWLIPALPFAGFLALALLGSRMPRPLVATIGAGTVGLSALAAIAASLALAGSAGAEEGITRTLWTWISVGGFAPAVALRLDALSAVMTLVVTIVGFLILLYSTEFMAGDEGYSRFFCCMDLFVGAMLTLVLADDLLLLYLGWEGVGLSSYLLIGFWYKAEANVRAARKAFIVTRVGDTAFALGLALIATQLGTLRIQEVAERAPLFWGAGSGMAVAAAALMLGGALGKSAQLPLQTWLPDAMAGPTPVSALIHAATMVTAGVYLIARMHALFLLAPVVMGATAVIGAATLLMAGLSALTQSDLKRALAYSTISQVGYMFLALGVGAWSAAIFHFMTHAFFKSLLFLAAGAVSMRLRGEHDMFRMGGLRRALPGAFWAFVIGAASLSALPMVTAGFYSKEMILERVWSSPRGAGWLWAAGLIGALITALYAFRMVFLVFFGEKRQETEGRSGARVMFPLAALAALSIGGGFVPMSRGTWEAHALPLTLAASLASLLGIAGAWFLFHRRRGMTERLAGSPAGALLRRFWAGGWGFDQAYDALLVRPFVRLTRASREEFADPYSKGVARTAGALHHLLSRTVTGQLRWYAMAIAAGTILLIGMAVFL